MGWEGRGQEKPLPTGESRDSFLEAVGSWTKILMGGDILCTKNRTKHGETGACKRCLGAGKGPISQEQRASVGVEDKIRLEEWARARLLGILDTCVKELRVLLRRQCGPVQSGGGR